MMVRFGLLGSLLLLGALPCHAQSFESDLPPSEKLILSLSNADLHVSWRAGSPSHLKALPADPAAPSAEPATEPAALELRPKGEVLEVRRHAEASGIRLRVDLVLAEARSLTIVGSGLDLVLTAPGSGQAMTSKVALNLVSSRAELSGLAGASLQGQNSYFLSRASSQQLKCRLEGGGAEIEGHRGSLEIESEGSEFTVRDVAGQMSFLLNAGLVEVSQAEGQLAANLARGATLRLAEWAGEATLDAKEASLELRNFWAAPQTLKVHASQSEVVIEGMESGNLEIDQEGGSLSMQDIENIEGKITTNFEARVEIYRISGGWLGTFQDSEVLIENAQRLEAELYNGKLDLEAVAELSLIAHGSEVQASEVGQITVLNLVTSTARVGLQKGARANVMVQGLSNAELLLPTPCFVQIEEPEAGDGSVLEVSGCTLRGAPPGTAQESADTAFLTGAVGGNSKLVARAAF